MGVSKSGGTPKSSILIGCSITNHPFWGTPIVGNTQIWLNFRKKNVQYRVVNTPSPTTTTSKPTASPKHLWPAPWPWALPVGGWSDGKPMWASILKGSWWFIAPDHTPQLLPTKSSPWEFSVGWGSWKIPIKFMVQNQGISVIPIPMTCVFSWSTFHPSFLELAFP